MEYITVEEAIEAPGLRLVLTAGVPGPWGESAKAILSYKEIPFTPVYQQGGGENRALKAWTGQTSAPVAVYEDRPPVCHWLDLLMLAEQLAPARPLLPEDMALRTRAIGLSALIVGVDGFGFNRRLQMLAPMMALDPIPEIAVTLAAKYGYSEQARENSTGRLQAISALLDAGLMAQQAAGSDYFVGDSVTVVDFYWANFAGMVLPLGPRDNPMPDPFRATYESSNDETRACITPRLEAHRDMMYRRHIALPLDF